MAKSLLKFSFYNKDGDFIDSYTKWAGVGFSSEINNADTTCNISVSERAFTDSSILNLTNRIKITATNSNHPNGVDLYSGEVVGNDRETSSGEVNYTLVLAGAGLDFNSEIFVDNDNLNVNSFTRTDISIGNALRKVIDFYNANVNTNIYYTNDSIPLANELNNLVSFEIKGSTYFECFKEIVEMLPFNYFWKIENDGLARVGTLENQEPNYLINPTSIISKKESVNIADMVNSWLGYNGDTLTGTAEDIASINAFGKRQKTYLNRKIRSQVVLDNRLQRKLELSKNLEASLDLTLGSSVFDKLRGVDIEKFKVGETFKIQGEGLIRVITKISYDINKITLTTNDIRNTMNRQLQDVENRTGELEKENFPSSF
ncbi:MAG: hypothetical protein ACRCTS_03500 [Fusobacteriaceae bacterium]